MSRWNQIKEGDNDGSYGRRRRRRRRRRTGVQMRQDKTRSRGEMRGKEEIGEVEQLQGLGNRGRLGRLRNIKEALSSHLVLGGLFLCAEC